MRTFRIFGSTLLLIVTLMVAPSSGRQTLAVETGSLGNGAVCTRSSQCASWFCEAQSGTCFPRRDGQGDLGGDDCGDRGNCLNPMVERPNRVCHDFGAIGFRCVECETDGDCVNNYKCLTTTDQFVCVQCLADSDCTNGQVCDTVTNTCCGCAIDADCGENAACLDNSVCVRCTSDDHCGDGAVCTDEHTCVQCEDDADCSRTGAVCENNICVECRRDGDCDDKESCNARNVCTKEELTARQLLPVVGGIAVGAGLAFAAGSTKIGHPFKNYVLGASSRSDLSEDVVHQALDQY